MGDGEPYRSSRAFAWVGMVLAIAALYFARKVFIPLALAILLSFLLGPLVVLLRRWRLGRILSVVVSVGTACALVGLIGWLMVVQLYDLAGKLPLYQSNMQKKVQSFSSPGGGIFAKSARMLREMGEDIGKAGRAVEVEQARNGPPTAKPVPVEIRQPDPTAMHLLRNFAAALANPLTTAFIVIVFVIFMLINREDLRDRLIGLVGAGQLNLTTTALDDAAHRVSRFLLMQFIINACYGIAIGIGLWLAGVPNPLLWGLFAALLRFVPYVGPWLGAAMPVLLAFAVEPGWAKLLATVGVFLGTELITYNILEPWLYSSCTGISSIAILGAAVFWTWLWGPIGLLLSTPLTVCLVVIGRHVPHLGFLSMLLGDEPALTPQARFYQRLLAMNYDEASDLADQFVAENSVREFYEQVAIPALTLAEEDRHRGILDTNREKFIFDSLRELIQDLPERKPIEKEGVVASVAAKIEATATEAETSVLCLPAADQADEIAGLMLTQLLLERGVAVRTLPAGALAAERLETVAQEEVSIVCVSALPPSAVTPAKYVCKKLHAQMPNVKIIVGIWQANADISRLQQRMGNVAEAVVTSLTQAVEHISPMATGATAKASEEAAEQPSRYLAHSEA